MHTQGTLTVKMLGIEQSLCTLAGHWHQRYLNRTVTCVHSWNTGHEDTWNRTVTMYTPGTVDTKILAVKMLGIKQSLCTLLGQLL